MAKRIGFVHYDKEKPAKDAPIAEDSQVEMALDAYFCNESDSGRFTSEEIALNLRETIKISPSPGRPKTFCRTAMGRMRPVRSL